MTLVDLVIKYYDKEYDLNCSESILRAASEYYDLDLQKQTIRAMASFGGGMAIESVCGAATGAIAVLGIMFTEDRGHQSPHVKMMTSEFMNEFNKNMRFINCNELKVEYKDREYERCTYMMIASAKILQEIVEKYKKNYSVIR